MEMRLPGWVRSIGAISALMQLGFGIALLLHPARISELWPWTLPPLTARLLGASTLASIPLAFLSIGINRYRMAIIPFVMMLTYRVLQLVAGVIHIDRFTANSTLTLNYFGGGMLMLVVFAYPLIAGSRGRLPKASAEAPFATPMPWRPHPLLRDGLALLSGALIVLGLAFLILGGSAKGAVVRRQGDDAAYRAAVRFPADRTRSRHDAGGARRRLARDHDPGPRHGDDRRARHTGADVKRSGLRAAESARVARGGASTHSADSRAGSAAVAAATVTWGTCGRSHAHAQSRLTHCCGAGTSVTSGLSLGLMRTTKSFTGASPRFIPRCTTLGST